MTVSNTPSLIHLRTVDSFTRKRFATSRTVNKSDPCLPSPVFRFLCFCSASTASLLSCLFFSFISITQLAPVSNRRNRFPGALEKIQAFRAGITYTLLPFSPLHRARSWLLLRKPFYQVYRLLFRLLGEERAGEGTCTSCLAFRLFSFWSTIQGILSMEPRRITSKSVSVT